ncbi:MAG: DUF2269 family protein [Amnibacterium sp.]
MTVLLALHVVAAVFLVGPMAILPMSGLRAIRSGQAGQVMTLARSTNLLSILSVIVVILGFALMGLAPAKDHLTIVTPWILISLLCWAAAAALDLWLVVPTLRRAAEALEGGETGARYPAVAAGSGIAALLLVAVVVLMVVRP